MMKMAVLVSGGGTNLQAIMDAMDRGEITNAEIAVVISNNANAYALERAKMKGIEAICVSPKAYASRAEFNQALLETIQSYDVELVVLAGCLVVIPEIMVKAYPNKIINIHPALLPSFKGAHGIEDAFSYGVKVFGVTVHYVTKELDGGPIIAQRGFEYYGDSIEEVEAKIHEIEHELYPFAINRIIKEN